MEALLYITWPWRRSESFQVVYDGDKQPLIDIFSAKTHPVWISVSWSTPGPRHQPGPGPGPGPEGEVMSEASEDLLKS